MADQFSFQKYLLAYLVAVNIFRLLPLSPGIITQMALAL